MKDNDFDAFWKAIKGPENSKGNFEKFYLERQQKNVQDRFEELASQKLDMEKGIEKQGDVMNYLCFSDEEKHTALGMPYKDAYDLVKGIENGRWILPSDWSIQQCYEWVLIECELMALFNKQKMLELQMKCEKCDFTQRGLIQEQIESASKDWFAWSVIL